MTRPLSIGSHRQRGSTFSQADTPPGVGVSTAFGGNLAANLLRRLHFSFLDCKCPSTRSSGGTMQTPLRQSPRPAPDMFENSSFTQRKRTPFRAPPKAPAKSCPPVSRIFSRLHHHQQPTGPQLISFKSERKTEPIRSPLYDHTSSKSYFEQCFEVLGKIGEGSFGEVFKVRSREDGHVYAVKRSRQVFRGETDRRRQMVEVEKHERLPPHTNCVRFYKGWEERGHLYIQTELCQMSLADYANLHGRISESRVWTMLVDLIQGLKHLHDNNLCHLDIKPANIFIGQDGFTCKLGDFGLCVSTEDGFKDAVEGDSRYLARELMQGQFSTAADIFSLGISLLELACDLELPSGGPTWQQLREGELPLEFLSHLSPDLISLLSAMMHQDPASRPDVTSIQQHWCVRRYSYWIPLMRGWNRTVYYMAVTCRWIHRVAMATYYLLLMLMAFILRRKNIRVITTPPTPTQQPHPWEDTFSDDDDVLSTSCDQNGMRQLNKSWMNVSPLSYPTRVNRSCSPIPLDYELVDDNSSNDEDLSDSFVSQRTRFMDSPIGTSSPAAGRTPVSRPSMQELARARNLSIGPRNLMELFSDAPPAGDTNH